MTPETSKKLPKTTIKPNPKKLKVIVKDKHYLPVGEDVRQKEKIWIDKHLSGKMIICMDCGGD